MLAFTRVLESFILPPGGLLLLVVAGLVLLLAKRRRIAALLLGLAIVGSYLLSIEPVASAMMIPLEDTYPALTPGEVAGGAKPGVDAVVILGGGSIAGAPDAPGLHRLAELSAEAANGTRTGGTKSAGGAKSTTTPSYTAYVSLSADGVDRLAYGYALARARKLPIIVAGGAPLKQPGTESEAEASKALLVAMGADPAQIRTENRSQTTWENAVNVQLDYHPSAILLVTSAYHMRRAVYCFRKQGITVVPAPTNYTVSRTPPRFGDFLPSSYALQTSSTAIRERIAMLFYRVRYGALPK